MPFLLRFLVPLCLAMTTLGASAAVPAGDPYVAEVPVAGNDVAQRDDAIARALRAVVVKASGDPRAVSRLRSVRDAGELVVQYQYGIAPGGARVLRVAFDREAVDDLLRDDAATGVAPTPAPAAASAERFRVQVRGVDSFVKHARVMRLVQGAPGVESAVPRAARGDVLLIEVTSRAGTDSLDQAARAAFLAPDPGTPAVPSTAAGPWSFEGARLRYRVMQ